MIYPFKKQIGIGCAPILVQHYNITSLSPPYYVQKTPKAKRIWCAFAFFSVNTDRTAIIRQFCAVNIRPSYHSCVFLVQGVLSASSAGKTTQTRDLATFSFESSFENYGEYASHGQLCTIFKCNLPVSASKFPLPLYIGGTDVGCVSPDCLYYSNPFVHPKNHM